MMAEAPVVVSGQTSNRQPRPPPWKVLCSAQLALGYDRNGDEGAEVLVNASRLFKRLPQSARQRSYCTVWQFDC